MLEFKDYISLLESKSTAKRKFLDKGLISEELFNIASDLDKTKTKKYLEKIISLWLDEGGNNLIDIGEIMMDFDNLLTKNKIIGIKDITQYKTLKDIQKTIRRSMKLDVQREVDYLKRGNFTTIIDNDDLLVVIPNDLKSSCQWGHDTNWCTTSKFGHESGDDYYTSYTTKRGATLYYIFIKNSNMIPVEYPTYEYIAIAVYPNNNLECWDADDDNISFKDVLYLTGLDASIFVNRKNII